MRTYIYIYIHMYMDSCFCMTFPNIPSISPKALAHSLPPRIRIGWMPLALPLVNI